MPGQTRVVLQGPNEREVRFESGEVIPVPTGWDLLPPGDATLTRRVNAAGPTWKVQEKRGRKIFSHGVWAPSEHIVSERAKLEVERESPSYQKKLTAGRERRRDAQDKYVGDFRAAVQEFLQFDQRFRDLEAKLAEAVTSHATPVGSGTIARTGRIPVERRAEAAVIAWMRHQTTAYDNLVIPRVKGARRQTRRLLAEHSRTLLDRYRRGSGGDRATCPLYRAFE